MTSQQQPPPPQHPHKGHQVSQRTFLGFDYGSKRIGVAIGQELTATARPLATLVVKNRQIPWQSITELVKQWQPDALVLGMPLNKDQSEHEISQAARRFGNQLNGRYNLPVYWVDERLTSYAAEQLLSQADSSRRHGKRGSGKGVSVDSVAAQLILESWLQHPAARE